MKIKKVLVSQPKPDSGKSPYFDIAKKYDLELIFRPFIKVEGLSAKEFRTQKVNIADYTGGIFPLKRPWTITSDLPKRHASMSPTQ